MSDAPAQTETSAPPPGQTFNVAYPFVRSTYSFLDADEDGCAVVERPTWKPGTRNEDWGTGYVESFADGMGRMTLTVVSTHKPGKFPPRVFFTRKFTDPDGREFGKGKCHITTLEKFRRLSRGYQHPYALGKAEAK